MSTYLLAFIFPRNSGFPKNRYVNISNKDILIIITEMNGKT